MKTILVNGPVHGQEVDIAPGVMEHRVAISRPIDVLNPFPHDVTYPVSVMPNYDVAVYRFSGTGLVNLDGTCTALIFHYLGASYAS